MVTATFALSTEQVDACVASLLRTIDALGTDSVDLSALRPLVTTKNVVAAAVTGAVPSPCTAQVTRMLAGGLGGLRAFLHLATETGQLVASGFDPGSDATPVEPVVAPHAAGCSAEQLVLMRHAALFTFDGSTGPTAWARAHAMGLTAELELMESLLASNGATFDRGQLFWFDPGLSPHEIAENVDFLTRLGVPIPPQSTADRASLRAVYVALQNRCGDTATSLGAEVVTKWP